MHQSAFNILSLDGGGIKGIIPCSILIAIEQKTGKPISDLFHLIAGTSTGGIIALGMSKPAEFGRNAYSAHDMLDLYVKNGKDIFSKRKEDFWSKLGSLFEKTESIATHNYNIENFEALLEQKFGNTRLKESLVKLLVTTYDIEQGKPFYFSTRLAKQDPKEDILMRSIARSTSAAPTFFEPSLIKYTEDQETAFVDGGVFANNPSILAYSEAKELWRERQKLLSEVKSKGFEAIVTADDLDLPFYMLSLGCGHSTTQIKAADAKKWRAIEWAQPLLTDIFMRSVEESTDYTMKHLLPPYQDGTVRYQRLDPALPAGLTQMDNASEENINKLLELSERFVKDNDKAIDQVCKMLVG